MGFHIFKYFFNNNLFEYGQFMAKSNVQNWFQSQTEDRPHGAADPSYFSAGFVITKGSWGGGWRPPGHP